MTKKIAAITMARNDNFFLARWIEYYGAQIGKQNLFVCLDGLDQDAPANADGANIKKFPHDEQSRQRGDKTRILLLSELARRLFELGYDIVIGCDCDEFLATDSDVGLAGYLSSIDGRANVSGLGLDVGMDLKTEKELDKSAPFLAQRKYAFMSTRYTKPVVLFRPATWGSGFHSVKGQNFHIDKHLFLLHFGSVDMEMIKEKLGGRDTSWDGHLKKRARTINIITAARNKNRSVKLARIFQTILRPIYDLNKPAMMGIKWVTTIPDALKKTGI